MIKTEQSVISGKERSTEASGVPTVSAVAVSPPENSTWCVAIVKRNSEKVIRDELREQGIEAYVATQTMRVKYAKRRPKDVEYVRLPAKVFLHLSFKDGKQQDVFRMAHPGISSFMPDYARPKDVFGRPVIAAISDGEMTRMRRWLDDTESEVLFGAPDASFEIGDWVRAVGTRLDGEVGRVASKAGKSYIVLEIKGLSWATVQIPTKHLIPLDAKST